jgi:hypothetical protein
LAGRCILGSSGIKADVLSLNLWPLSLSVPVRPENSP